MLRLTLGRLAAKRTKAEKSPRGSVPYVPDHRLTGIRQLSEPRKLVEEEIGLIKRLTDVDNTHNASAQAVLSV